MQGEDKGRTHPSFAKVIPDCDCKKGRTTHSANRVPLVCCVHGARQGLHESRGRPRIKVRINRKHHEEIALWKGNPMDGYIPRRE